MTSYGNQTQIIPTSDPEFPWRGLNQDRLTGIALNNIIIALQNQITALQNQVVILQGQVALNDLGVSMTLDFGGGNTITPGPYVLVATAPYSFTITSADYVVGATGGSFQFTVVAGGNPVPGLTNVQVGAIFKQNTLAGPNSFVQAGQELRIVISNVIGAPSNCYICINGVTNAIPVPVVGITAGFALGTSFAIGQGFASTAGRSIGVVVAGSTATATGMAIDDGYFTATGSSSANAHGAAVLLNAALATASGTSSTAFVGIPQSGVQYLILDDPTFGALDSFPIQ
jgi:hypothetical protein